MKNAAKPKESTDSAREERLWELYKLAFAKLVTRHICLPSQFFDAHGDRELESAQDTARAAVTLAFAAEYEWRLNVADRPSAKTKRRTDARPRGSRTPE
jgi:hypothetical protein